MGHERQANNTKATQVSEIDLQTILSVDMFQQICYHTLRMLTLSLNSSCWGCFHQVSYPLGPTNCIYRVQPWAMIL